jgi:dGTPase
MAAKNIYENNFLAILEGKFKTAIFDIIKKDCKALKEITKFSYEYIYNHRSVVEIENAGFNVMYELLSHFVPPILIHKDDRRKADEKAVRLIPKQFLYEGGNHYQKVLGILDYVSGMTDNYAADLYKKIKGIDIGMTI